MGGSTFEERITIIETASPFVCATTSGSLLGSLHPGPRERLSCRTGDRRPRFAWRRCGVGEQLRIALGPRYLAIQFLDLWRRRRQKQLALSSLLGALRSVLLSRFQSCRAVEAGPDDFERAGWEVLLARAPDSSQMREHLTVRVVGSAAAIEAVLARVERTRGRGPSAVP